MVADEAADTTLGGGDFQVVAEAEDVVVCTGGDSEVVPSRKGPRSATSSKAPAGQKPQDTSESSLQKAAESAASQVTTHMTMALQSAQAGGLPQLSSGP